MKKTKNHYEELAMFCDAENADMIDHHYPISIHMKTKKDISPGQIVMIVLLSLILLFMLLMRYFARIQLVNVFEQDFMELEKYEYMKSISEDKDTKNKMEIKNNINPFIQENTVNYQSKHLENVPSPLSPSTTPNPMTAIPPNFLPSKPTINPENEESVAGITLTQLTLVKQLLELKNQPFPETTPLSEKEKQYYEQKYKISTYSKELPICVVIPSFNNMKDNRYKHNLDSVLMQDYNNYHIVYIDDASTDGTGKAVDEYFKNQPLPDLRYLVIHNNQTKFAMPNLRLAAKNHCHSNEIFIIVDGDDELLGRQVFKLFNSLFQAKNIWFLYSNFYSSRGTIGFSREIPPGVLKTNTIRKYPYVTSHLRAFYTQLFKNIHEEDLKDDKGEYFHSANDIAILIPVIEQSGTRVAYISEMTYFYNFNTGLNNHLLRRSEQRNNEKIVRNKKSYTPLAELKFDPV